MKEVAKRSLVLRLICLLHVPLLHREIFHIRMVLEQLNDVYVGTVPESFCDAMVYVFPAGEPLDLLAPRLRLACNDSLLQDNLSALEALAASADVGINAVPPASAMAIMHANRAVAKRDIMHFPWFAAVRRTYRKNKHSGRAKTGRI